MHRPVLLGGLQEMLRRKRSLIPFTPEELNVGNLGTASQVGGSEKSLLLSASQASVELSCLGQDLELKLT